MKYDRRSTNKWGEKGCQKLQFGSCHLFFSLPPFLLTMKYDRRSTNKWGEKGCQKLQFGSCHPFFSARVM